jgi:hypothetical protein
MVRKTTIHEPSFAAKRCETSHVFIIAEYNSNCRSHRKVYEWVERREGRQTSSATIYYADVTEEIYQRIGNNRIVNNGKHWSWKEEVHI